MNNYSYIEQDRITPYRRYSDYLRNIYGAKVYKLSVNLPVTCPNRDGTVSSGGCTFCGDFGAGVECLPSTLSVTKQLSDSADKMKKLYKAEKFIAYFQNFTNTYLPLSDFISNIKEAAEFGIVEFAISTRPDCIRDDYLVALREICDSYGLKATIELGLQTVNYHTLNKINRGHTLAEYLDAVLRIKRYGFEICTHIILNLPWDTREDTIETAKILSALSIDQVKLHALYIAKNTEMAKQYQNDEFTLISCEEYKERVKLFLEYLSPETIIQRIIGRVAEEGALFANWGISWWKIHDEINAEMLAENRFQGKNFNYLNGSALKKFS